MEYIRLGKTNALVSRVAFGAMRLTDKIVDEDAAVIVRKAYEAGVNFFDTSRKTPVSEKLLGDALYDIRMNVFLSTTTSAKTPHEINEELETSLMTLHCDSIDLYQFETEKFLPEPGGADRIYDTLVQAKNDGKIKHIGIVTTNIDTAYKAVESGLYETLQFPFSMLSSEQTWQLVKLCEENDMGFIAMQPLGGGLLNNIPLALGFLSQYENVVPIWGIQTQEELTQILYFNEHPPVIDEQFQKDVDHVRNFFN
ncbi:MAG: aldo/keto reductase [Treponema sp.]|nr:aldo/keto reductase [Treponema sp.]